MYTTYHSDQGANPATSFRIYKTEMITQKNSDPYNDTVKGFFETEVITPENAKSRLVMQSMSFDLQNLTSCLKVFSHGEKARKAYLSNPIHGL